MSVQVTESAKTTANGEITEYKSLVNYAGTFADTLLFIHYVAVLLIEIRHVQPTFYLKVNHTSARYGRDVFRSAG